MAEQWKAVAGFEGFYEVSNLGRVRSLPRNGTRGVVLKPGINQGYRRVILVVNGGKRWNKKVAILVARAFIPNPENKPTVNHKDLNRANDRVKNLEWATRSEQSLHLVMMKAAGAHIGAKGSKHLMSKINTKQVLEIRKRYAAGGISQFALGKQYEISQGMVGLIVRGTNWKHAPQI